MPTAGARADTATAAVAANAVSLVAFISRELLGYVGTVPIRRPSGPVATGVLSRTRVRQAVPDGALRRSVTRAPLPGPVRLPPATSPWPGRRGYARSVSAIEAIDDPAASVLDALKGLRGALDATVPTKDATHLLLGTWK